MSTPNVISLDSRKAQNEAKWQRTQEICTAIAIPAMGLYAACDDRNQEQFDQCMRELRAVAVRELGLSELSNQAAKGSKP